MKFVSLVFLFLIFSCEKEEPHKHQETYDYCRSNMRFECNLDEGAPFFFKARLNGEDFCISAYQGADPLYYNSVSGAVATISTTSTSDPVLRPSSDRSGSLFNIGISTPIHDNLNGITRDFDPLIRIKTPRVLGDSIYPAEYYIERFFQVGELPLRKEYMEDTEGFYFAISWGCVLRPGYEYYHQRTPDMIPSIGIGLSPSFGSAPTGKLELVEKRRVETPTTIQYYMTFHIETELYYSSYTSRLSGDNFGMLEEGVFRTVVEIPR